MIEYDLYLSEEQYPSMVARFSEDEPEAVKFTKDRYGVWSDLDEYVVSYHETEEAAQAEAERLQAEEHADDDDEMVFWVQCPEVCEEMPEWWEALQPTERYVRQNAWRGYTEVAFEAEDHGLVKFASGWVTGYPDSTVSYKVIAGNLYNALYKGMVHPPVPVLWTFSTSSNVFSTISDLWVREADLGTFREWLQSIDFDPEDVARAFT